MKTKIRTIHEEDYTDKTKTLGILFNYIIESNVLERKESLIYIYKEGMYIFFQTMIDAVDYLLYGEKKMKRAYMEEVEFDKYYDIEIDGEFNDKLEWI